MAARGTGAVKPKRIGGWSFDPASGELTRGEERQRLEPRAARTLELLCDANGAVVSHDRLIAEVWGGRSLSDNSVAVVIGQLRRALGDEERKLIENVPKRGYRLAANGATATTSLPRRRWIVVACLILAAVVLAAAMILGRGTSADIPIAVADVVNETGDASLGPHARATSELIVHELGQRGFAVRRGARDDALTLRTRLLIWDGRPFLGMTATAPDGTVRWTAMRPGGPAEAPASAAAAVDELKAAISGG